MHAPAQMLVDDAVSLHTALATHKKPSCHRLGTRLGTRLETRLEMGTRLDMGKLPMRVRASIENQIGNGNQVEHGEHH